MRKLRNNAIETSLRGEDPPSLIRDRAHNRLVHVNMVERWVNAEELREHVPNIVYVS